MDKYILQYNIFDEYDGMFKYVYSIEGDNIDQIKNKFIIAIEQWKLGSADDNWRPIGIDGLAYETDVDWYEIPSSNLFRDNLIEVLTVDEYLDKIKACTYNFYT